MYSAPLLAAEGSPSKEAPDSPSKWDANDLPDLTDRLKELGIYGSYLEWRDSYMQWRKGGVKGAKGENSMAAHTSKSHFQDWYPTVATFTFRRTISFWAPVLTCEGCLFFLWIPFCEEHCEDLSSGLLYHLTKIPNIYGGLCFLVGVYLVYFELINMFSDVDTRKLNYLWCDMGPLMSLESGLPSVLGALAYVVGALIYTVAQVSDFYELEEGWRSALVDWPYIIGGFLFFAGGLCELRINRVFSSPPTTSVWWVSVLNTCGGLAFWLSVCPTVVAGTDAVLVGVAGDLTYLLGALLQLVMWRGELFGLSLIPALNKVHREEQLVVRTDKKTGASRIVMSMVGLSPRRGEDESKLDEVLSPRFSWRGLAFLSLFLFIGFLQGIICFVCLSKIRKYAVSSPQFRRILSEFILGASNLVSTHMVLVVSSVCVTLPKENPYRTLMALTRVIAIVVLLNSLLEMDTLFEL